MVLGYDARADDSAISLLGLPPLDDPTHALTLTDAYPDAGFAVSVEAAA